MELFELAALGFVGLGAGFAAVLVVVLGAAFAVSFEAALDFLGLGYNEYQVRRCTNNVFKAGCLYG